MAPPARIQKATRLLICRIFLFHLSGIVHQRVCHKNQRKEIDQAQGRLLNTERTELQVAVQSRSDEDGANKKGEVGGAEGHGVKILAENDMALPTTIVLQCGKTCAQNAGSLSNLSETNRHRSFKRRQKPPEQMPRPAPGPLGLCRFASLRVQNNRPGARWAGCR